MIVKPGDSFEIKDMKVTAVESFDRTCLVTLPVEGADAKGGELAGLAVTDDEMARKAVNYVFETLVEQSIMAQIHISQTTLQNMVVTLRLMLH